MKIVGFAVRCRHDLLIVHMRMIVWTAVLGVVVVFCYCYYTSVGSADIGCFCDLLGLVDENWNFCCRMFWGLGNDRQGAVDAAQPTLFIWAICFTLYAC